MGPLPFLFFLEHKDLYHSEIRILEISRFRVLGSMVRKKGTPIYFAVNQRDPMVVQAVKPFKPFGPFVTEVLQMSGREPMQPATVEVQNWRNHSNPAIAHETECIIELGNTTVFSVE